MVLDPVQEARAMQSSSDTTKAGLMIALVMHGLQKTLLPACGHSCTTPLHLLAATTRSLRWIGSMLTCIRVSPIWNYPRAVSRSLSQLVAGLLVARFFRIWLTTRPVARPLLLQLFNSWRPTHSTVWAQLSPPSQFLIFMNFNHFYTIRAAYSCSF